MADNVEVWYMEEQDKSNFWHNLTNKELCVNFADLLEKMDEVEESLVLRNLRRCEHLRWNAKMRLLGFVNDGDNKDVVRRSLRCIADCVELEREDRKSVV